MTIRVRRATRDEAASLTALAHRSKRHWGYPDRWIAIWREALTLTPELIDGRQVFVAADGGAIAGVHALAFDGEECSVEHFWVDPRAMGRGVGRRLFEHAARFASDHGAKRLVIESDPHAEGFYLRMGARRAGEVPADIEGTRRCLPRLIFDLSGGDPPPRPGGAGDDEGRNARSPGRRLSRWVFVPAAPGTVRAAAALVIAGSLLEAVFAVRHHWPERFSLPEIWAVVSTPAGSLLTGVVLAILIGRMVIWGYWLLVLLWVPLMFIGTGAVLWQMAAGNEQALPEDRFVPVALAALVAYLAACVLLLAAPTRRAIRMHGRRWW